MAAEMCTEDAMFSQRLRSERGAIIIHVAIALLALLAFTSFVVDYGVMWVSRRQAQTAADSGALSGALALLFGGDPNQAAEHFAGENVIWGEVNNPDNVDVTLSGPGVSIPPCAENPGCVRVDVYRNTPQRGTLDVMRGAALPTYFAQLVGLNTQGVRATATAETASGNLVKCLLPFAVADRWSDTTDNMVATYPNDGLSGVEGWSPNDLYEDTSAGGTDSYTPPSDESSGTGWTVAGDYGRQLILKDGEVGQFSAGWANKVDLPGSTGSAEYRADIKGCNETPVGIAQPDQTCAGFPNSGTTVEEAKVGCLGVSSGLTVGPTEQGVDGGGPGGAGLVEQDPNVFWSDTVENPQSPTGRGGVARLAADGVTHVLVGDSPRIRPIAIFDITHYMSNPACKNQAGTGCVIRVSNIVGFFVEGMCPDVALDAGMACAPNPEGKNQVVGRIVTDPSNKFNGAGELDDEASFLRIVRLVR
jgi:hypothetical protein